MKRQSKLNERTLEMARKENEKMMKLLATIEKAEAKVEEMKRENRWMSYLGDSFYQDATDDQEIEFFKQVKEIR